MTASLIAIASGKGGVGKTFLSISLAQAFARSKQQRTLLVDGDVGLANVDVSSGSSPKGDLLQVVAGTLPMDQAVAACAIGGFDALAGRSGSGAMHGAGRAGGADRQGLSLVSSDYDRTVVDLAAGLDDMVLDLARRGCTYRSSPTRPTSLTDAYALIKVLSQRDKTLAMAIAVNMAATTAEGRRSMQPCATRRSVSSASARRSPASSAATFMCATRSRAQAPFLTRYPAARRRPTSPPSRRQLDGAFMPVLPGDPLASQTSGLGEAQFGGNVRPATTGQQASGEL